MPTHWESSERPLFVRTVVVNGSRHAILSHVDPLCQARKSDSSPEGLEPSREDMNPRRIRSCYPSKRDISSELQNCLVKLRVVLSTQEQRRGIKKEVPDAKEEVPSRVNWKRIRKSIQKKPKSWRDELRNKYTKEEDITGFRKGNSYCSAILKKESDDNSEDTDGSNSGLNPAKPEIEHPGRDVAKMPDRTNLIRRVLPLSDATEELLRNYSSYFFPIVYIKSDSITWDEITGESAVPKNSHNPLSERVMQWLDLARRRKESLNVEKSRSVAENQQKTHGNAEDRKNKKNKPVRCKSEGSLGKSGHDEDVEGEVKQESDIETVLSSTSTREYPKYSRELNKLHIMKNESPRKPTERVPVPREDHWESIISIPEKISSDFSLTEQLQQSILESFEAIVNLERKAALERTKIIHSSRKKSYRVVRNSSGRTSRKKSLLMKPMTLRISSDEEEPPENVRRRIHTAGKRQGYTNGKKSWKYGQRVLSAKNEKLDLSDESARDVRIIYNETPLSNAEKNHGGRRIWATEKGAKKPHLHIFMPEINPKNTEANEESTSDTESNVK